jgi:hypothetical protein
VATATTVALYRGTEATFSADAQSATSAQGTFVPVNSGFTSLEAALAGGMIIAGQSEIMFAIPGGAQPGYCWTLQTGGVL